MNSHKDDDDKREEKGPKRLGREVQATQGKKSYIILFLFEMRKRKSERRKYKKTMNGCGKRQGNFIKDIFIIYVYG